MISTLAEALEEFKRHGLVGAVQGGWLMVGTAVSEKHPGIRVYDNAFAIEGQDGDWVLRTDRDKPSMRRGRQPWTPLS